MMEPSKKLFYNGLHLSKDRGMKQLAGSFKSSMQAVFNKPKDSPVVDTGDEELVFSSSALSSRYTTERQIHPSTQVNNASLSALA